MENSKRNSTSVVKLQTDKLHVVISFMLGIKFAPVVLPAVCSHTPMHPALLVQSVLQGWDLANLICTERLYNRKPNPAKIGSKALSET